MEDEDQSKPYTTNNDQLIDSSALHHNINPDCPVCLKPVFWSRHILALDRVWHIQCFICCYCYKVSEQTFHSGKIYCTNPCFSKIFLIKCTGHDNFENKQNLENQPNIEIQENIGNQLNLEKQPNIENQLNLPNEKIEVKTNPREEVNEINKNLKNKCFHCLKCSNLIMNHHHHILHNNNYPFCKFSNYKKIDISVKEDQFKNNQSVDPSDFIGQNCSRCNKKVFASELCYSLNSPFHLKCLRCKICNRSLQPGLHTVHNGLPICSVCNNRFYSINGFRKGWYESKP